MSYLRIWSALFLMSALSFGCASTVSSVSGGAPVGAELGNRTFAQKLRDQGIENTAQVNLYKLDTRFKDQSRVNFHAFHDAVLITGQVPDPHLKTLAADSAKAIREVGVVHNELTVGPQSDYSTIVQDGITSAKVRTAIIQSDLKSSRVKYVVERGTVYLMGILYPAEVEELIASVKPVTGILRIVSLIDVIGNTAPVNQPLSSGVPTLSTTPMAGAQTASANPAVATPAAVNPYEQIDSQMSKSSSSNQQVLTQPIQIQTPQLTP